MKFDFSKALKKAQIDTGVRSVDLAAKLNIHKQQVARWRTLKDARIGLCVKLCDAMDIDLITFMRGGL